MSTDRKVVPPYFFCDYGVAEISAIQALERGEATPEQQKRALAWIINHAAGTYNSTFHPDGAHTSAFAEGRRYVGLQCIKLLKLLPSAFKGKQNA